MHDFLNKFLPLILSLILSLLVYLKVDQRFDITSKIDLKLKISQGAKSFLCFCFMAILIIFVGILNLVILNAPEIFTFIFSGALMGVSIPMSNKIRHAQ